LSITLILISINLELMGGHLWLSICTLSRILLLGTVDAAVGEILQQKISRSTLKSKTS
jgi:hypothetical protein